MVNLHRWSDPVSLEVIFAWLWQIVLVTFLILVGCVLQGRRNDQSSRGSARSEARLLLNRRELVQKRQHQVTSKRFSRLK